MKDDARPKIATVVGARPQFVKALPVSLALRGLVQEVLIHTGQHYGKDMSDIFFEELGLAEPQYNLGVGSGPNGQQTGRMLEAIERVLLKEEPDMVLVYGDTNSTLAGALAAAKLEMPLAHVEAGLRSYDRAMPEEVNRVVTDHVADILFCPTTVAVMNLRREGIENGVEEVGDVMYDSALYFGNVAEKSSKILEELELEPQGYLLATVHRAGNTDVPANLAALAEALISSGEPIIFPVHPRTRKELQALGLLGRLEKSAVRLVRPLGYLDFLKLEKYARKIITDSGGVQKEAYFFAIPCITLRENTEWVETVESGWNLVAGLDKETIVAAIRNFTPAQSSRKDFYGDGEAAKRIATVLCEHLKASS